jgi:hypothetical protein
MWIEKLAKHFTAELDEVQIELYADQLRNFTIHQLDTAFTRCLNECEFMPRLRDVRDRMPEDRYPADRRPFLQQKPITEIVRPYAEKIAQQLFGKRLDELDAKQTTLAFFHGNRARYKEMGIEWPSDIESDLKLSTLLKI